MIQLRDDVRLARANRSLNRAADTLIATSRLTRESWARYTSPMPPGAEQVENLVMCRVIAPGERHARRDSAAER